MKELGLLKTGVVSREERASASGVPSMNRRMLGPVAMLECIQNIPCNPCEAACPHQAITVGAPITNCPVIHEDKCIGCGLCIARCPGLAIFVVDESAEEYTSISIPYEYLPMPKEGEVFDALDRYGQAVGEARIVKVLCPPSFARTAVVTIQVPKAVGDDVRNIRKKAKHV